MADTVTLKALAERVGLLRGEDHATAAIDRLVAEDGATLRFSSGTYHLRLGGIGGSCTSGGHGLLDSWLRAARRRIARQEGAAQ